MEVVEIEKQVFKKMLSNRDSIAANLSKVSPDDFTHPLLRSVIDSLSKEGRALHFSPNPNYFEIILRDTIKDEARLQQTSLMLSKVAEEKHDAADLEVLIKELKANRMCRELTKIIKGAVSRITPGEVDDAYNELMADLLRLPLSAASGVSVATVKEVHENLDERIHSYLKADTTKFPTGLKAFDESIGGFAPGEFVVITAGTGQGKSNIMLWWAEQYVRSGANVLYVTIEMSYDETMNRYHAIATAFPVGDISNKRIPQGKLPDFYTKLLVHAKDVAHRQTILDECKELPEDKRYLPESYVEIGQKYANRASKFFVMDTDSANAVRIEREIQRLSMDDKIDYVFVDFINVMDPMFHNKDKVKELSSIARDLKKVARKTKVILFSAAQLDTTSLQGTPGEKIDPDRVKYSRAIGENADWMIAFNRTDEDNRMKQIRLQLAKHRHSGDAIALLEFDFATLQAIDLGKAEPPPPATKGPSKYGGSGAWQHGMSQEEFS